jgi:hypothetical protein
MKRPILFLFTALLAAAAVLLPGCQRFEEPQSLGPWKGGMQTVPLDVLHGYGGTTMAVVKVYSNNQGQFDFVLDTGASTSGVDQSLADALNLHPVRGRVPVAGVSEVTRRGQVRVDHWRLADTPLPAQTLLTLDMPEQENGTPLQGLLGSDVLNKFGIVRIDYERGVLVLPTRHVVTGLVLQQR